MNSLPENYHVYLELNTSNCNLKCIYCAIQTDKTELPSYPRQQMNEDICSHILPMLRKEQPSVINVCGNGETTILKNWTKVCEPFMDIAAVHIISNLAKELSWDEALFLARCSLLETSFDTVDSKLLNKIRKPVRLSMIIYNLNLVRTAAIAQGTNPKFVLNCALTNQTVKNLDRLILTCVAMGINSISFNDLFEVPTAIENNLLSLTHLKGKDFQDAIREIERAQETAEKHGIELKINRKIKELINNSTSEYQKNNTICCLQPWDNVFVHADGTASFCCRNMGCTEKSVLEFESIAEIRNHPNAVQLRKQLLDGDPPEQCIKCELGTPMQLSQFREQIKSFVHPSRNFIFRLIKQIPFIQQIKHIPFVRKIWIIYKRRSS